MDVEKLLVDAQLGVRLLKIEIRKLEQKNTRLRYELENDRVLASQPKHSGSTTDDDSNSEVLRLQHSMQSLEQTVSKLTKENSRLREQNEDLRKSSLREGVDELQTEEVVDPVYRMRKLLRRFSDLTVVSTITNHEKCPMCYDPFKVKECSALVCGHLICHVCLPSISRAASRDREALRCPVCERDTPREEVELVYMTEKFRWDRLTKVAQAWMAFDRRGELESSEEEDEEKFITDRSGTSEATSEAENNDDETIDDTTVQDAPDQEQPEGSERRQASPLPSPTCLLFSDSPSKLKRKRMEELAAERSQRKRS